MKILVIHNRYLESGGEDEVVRSEIEMLRRYGHKVIFYERSNQEIKSFSLCKKLSFLKRDIIWSKDNYREIEALIRQERPDLAHVHNIFVLVTPSVYYVLKENKIPVVQTLHNYRFLCPSGVFYRNGEVCEDCRGDNFTPAIIHKCWRGSYALSYLFAKTLRIHHKNNTFKEKIDGYIALSEFSKSKFIKSGFPEEKIFIKPNFLGQEIKKRDDFKEFVVFVGRLVDYKGVNTLISTFRKINKYYLKIIGDGPLYNELNKKLNGVENIELLGRLSHNETIEYIKSSSFLISPSNCYENMPRVLIESFACGVPVVASNGGAMKEFIQDGVTGLLFERKNSEDLGNKIEYLMKNRNLLRRMGESARSVYEEKYTLDKNYHMLMEIYNKFC